jgi:poly-gamma-glutamate synthesis protein (capsule biosynthesis protein)
MKQCTVLIGGDVCPTAADIAAFCRGDATAIFHDLLEDIAQADLTVVDLECPLTDHETPIPKCGPNLLAPMACIRAFKEAGVDVLDLANNHILDQGAAGLENTLAAAASAGIATVGAGRNLNEARRILIKNLQGIRVGILALAQHEFSIATSASPGANPLDLIDFTRNLAAERGNFDYLLVLVHAGNEHYPYPSPRLMETCRFFVEQGAGAVICHHTHCPGCWEEYRGGHIVYGQGNLVYGNPAGKPAWNEGFLVRLSISEFGKSEMQLAPFEQLRGQLGARKLQGAAAAAFLENISQRSKQIQDPSFVREVWLRFCEKERSFYLNSMLGHGRVLGWLNRHGRLVKYLYSPRTLQCAGAVIRCEAHREALETLLFPPDSPGC